MSVIQLPFRSSQTEAKIVLSQENKNCLREILNLFNVAARFLMEKFALTSNHKTSNWVNFLEVFLNNKFLLLSQVFFFILLAVLCSFELCMNRPPVRRQATIFHMHISHMYFTWLPSARRKN